MSELSDLELLSALGVEATAKKKATLTPKQERIIAGFEEIQRFVEEHGHPPMHGEDKDIFERLYATRLDQIRKLAECRELVTELDTQGLLDADDLDQEFNLDEIDDGELLAQLGVEAPKDNDITELKHVKTRAEIKAREEIANRTPCVDFDKFKPLFLEVQSNLDNGSMEAKLLKNQKNQDYMAQINKGDWFIVNGQKAYVAQFSDQRIHGFDKNDYRVRVIYDNGTENELLLRSLQKALYEDESGRRIVSLSAGPLFDDNIDEDDLSSGTIYVLRSKLDHPVLNQSRDVIHKIGVTGGDVKKRIGNAKTDPTYLMADVEIVATYELFNINRQKLEALIHRFFDHAKMEIQIMDRFGKPVVPREWFLVPLFVIDEVVEKIKDGTIGEYRYDTDSAALIKG
jgi:hypothetical protein